MLNSQSDQRSKRTPEDEDHKIQEAITRSLKEREPADSAPEQTHLHESCVGGDQLRCSVDLAKNDTYCLVGVVSHLGGTTHSGHYVSDVYSVERDQWLHYNDHRVNRVGEADVLWESPEERIRLLLSAQRCAARWCSRLVTVHIFDHKNCRPVYMCCLFENTLECIFS